MKNITYLFIVSFLIFYSCQRQKENLPSIQLVKGIYDEVSLRSNDMIKDLRLIKLETNIHCLIGPYINIYPSDSCIIVYSLDRILQFDNSGKFIRVLANKGYGPGEIWSIAGCIVNDKLNILYCIENNNPQKIHIYDLRKGTFTGDIPMGKKGFLSSIRIVRDSILACFPQMDMNGEYLVYYQDLTGNFKGGVPYSIRQEKGPVLRKSPEIMRIEDEFVYLNNRVDTLFKIGVDSKQSLCVLNRDEKNVAKGEIKLSISSIENFNICTSEFLILSSSNFKTVNMGNGNLIMKPTENIYLKVKWPSLTVCEIKEFYFDLLNESYKDSKMMEVFDRISSLRSNKIVFNYSASEIIELGKQLQKNGKDTLGLVNLGKSLNENDNPILLIGNIK